MKNKLWILIGVPGCGKSTYAKKVLNKHSSNTAIVSRDKIRFKLVKENEEYFSREAEVYQKCIKEVIQNLENPLIENILYDATNLRSGARSRFIQEIKEQYKKDFEINFIYFDVPLATCLERNNLREGRERVPNEIVSNMWRRAERPKDHEMKKIFNFLIVNENGGNLILTKGEKIK